MTLGKKIIELRKKQNLTQEKLSEKLKITRQTLSNWENDITVPDIKEAYKLANYFKISLDDLTNNNLEITCPKKIILTNIIGKECYIDLISDDYVEVYDETCQIVDVNNDFIKFSFKDKNKVIEKLIDINLVASIKVIESDSDK